MDRLAARNLCLALGCWPNARGRSLFDTVHHLRLSTFWLFCLWTKCIANLSRPIELMLRNLCGWLKHEHTVRATHPKCERHHHNQRWQYDDTLHSNDMAPSSSNWSIFCDPTLVCQLVYPFPDPIFESHRSYTNSPISFRLVTKIHTKPIAYARCMCKAVFRLLNPTIESLCHPNRSPIVFHLDWIEWIQPPQHDPASMTYILSLIVQQILLAADTQYWRRLHDRNFWNPTFSLTNRQLLCRWWKINSSMDLPEMKKDKWFSFLLKLIDCTMLCIRRTTVSILTFWRMALQMRPNCEMFTDVGKSNGGPASSPVSDTNRAWIVSGTIGSTSMLTRQFV